jgi:hypothetical protein
VIGVAAMVSQWTLAIAIFRQGGRTSDGPTKLDNFSRLETDSSYYAFTCEGALRRRRCRSGSG